MEGYSKYKKDEKAWRISQLLAGYLKGELSTERMLKVQPVVGSGDQSFEQWLNPLPWS